MTTPVYGQILILGQGEPNGPSATYPIQVDNGGRLQINIGDASGFDAQCLSITPTTTGPFYGTPNSSIGAKSAYVVYNATNQPATIAVGIKSASAPSGNAGYANMLTSSGGTTVTVPAGAQQLIASESFPALGSLYFPNTVPIVTFSTAPTSGTLTIDFISSLA